MNRQNNEFDGQNWLGLTPEGVEAVLAEVRPKIVDFLFNVAKDKPCAVALTKMYHSLPADSLEQNATWTLLVLLTMRKHGYEVCFRSVDPLEWSDV